MRVLTLAGLLVAIVGCTGSTEPYALQGNLSGDVVAGLSVQLVVSPGHVDQHGPFDVHVTVANHTGDTIRITTPNSCPFLPRVLRYGGRVPMEGSNLGCFTAVTTHVYPPGHKERRTFDMRAEYYSVQSGDVDGAPAPRGAYLVQMVFALPEAPTLGQSLQVY